MAPENPIDLRLDRRQWLKTSATMVGASLLPPAAVEALPQAEPKAAAPPAAARAAASAGHFFTPAQHAMVDELTETIIPADSHSGGAKAAKVADTIDRHLSETYNESERSLWREGLRLLDSMSQHYNGKSFVEASPVDRIAVLSVLAENSRMDDLPEVKFFNALKEATVEGYYTSKIGIHDELEYKGNRILKEYVGCDDQDAAKT